KEAQRELARHFERRGDIGRLSSRRAVADEPEPRLPGPPLLRAALLGECLLRAGSGKLPDLRFPDRDLDSLDRVGRELSQQDLDDLVRERRDALRPTRGAGEFCGAELPPASDERGHLEGRTWCQIRRVNARVLRAVSPLVSARYRVHFDPPIPYRID